MNKQEAIDSLKKDRYTVPFDAAELNYNAALDKAIGTVSKIDEPEKPVIQQFVADWYENYKDEFEYYLKGFISKVDYHINHNTKNQFYKWLGNPYNDPILTLVNMHQFGYEVEKKKLYTAKLKIITNGDNNYLNKYSDTERFTLSNLYTASGAYQTSFSRSELEQLNVWDNPVFEIKEADNEMD
ncbi:DUF1642 domain-containing protein [Streptococcus intermedius]